MMEFHPAANAFPMMAKDRLAELTADIQANGLRVPIVVCDGKILDGRNRAKACETLGISPITTLFTGDPWTYVWSLNGQRRDLSAEQRAHIWLFCNKNSEAWQAEQARIAEEANRKRSEAAKAQHEVSKPWAGEKMVVVPIVRLPSPEPERDKAKHAKAKQAGVNAGAIAKAAALEASRPDLAEKVRTGEIKPAEARRQAKKEEVMQKAAALPDGQFNVIYADPPWSYNDKQSGTLSESYGAAEKHYPSMSLSELSALDIKSLAADDCALFLWATSPLLPEALELAKAWGFKYKASFVWDKVKHNMGHFAKANPNQISLL